MPLKTVFVIESSKAREFLINVIDLGRKQEVRSQASWTRSIRVVVDWENLYFTGEKNGEISEFSYEWTIEEMREYLPTIKDAKIAGEVRATLEKGLHRRAIGIYLETEKFVKNLFESAEKI